jgi:hypothetical protein
MDGVNFIKRIFRKRIWALIEVVHKIHTRQGYAVNAYSACTLVSSTAYIEHPFLFLHFRPNLQRD